jgi:hypothetical protein
MWNKTKLKLTDTRGNISIKPWVSEGNNKEHLKSAKEAYKYAIEMGTIVELFKE